MLATDDTPPLRLDSDGADKPIDMSISTPEKEALKPSVKETLSFEEPGSLSERDDAICTPVKEEGLSEEESSGEQHDASLDSAEPEVKEELNVEPKPEPGPEPETEVDPEPEPEPEPGTSGSATPCTLAVLSSDSDSRERSACRPHKKYQKPKKRHRSSSSSSSSSSGGEDIDYDNLNPEQLKALIEEARRIRASKKKCKCPKKTWAELPVKGPTKPSGKCTIGKGQWSETSRDCAYCSSGIAHAHHVPRDPWQLEQLAPPRSRRKRNVPSRLNIVPLPLAARTKATVAGDVHIPVVELDSDDEDNSASVVVAEEVTVASTSEQVIVLSSDEDEIVCEKVIKPPVTEPVQVVAEPEPWPEPNIDLGNWDEAYNLLADLCGPSNEPEPRPATPPEEWSCPICLESKSSVPEIMSTVCGHIFCADCIRSAVKVHHKCPTCRKKLTVKQFHKIFL